MVTYTRDRFAARFMKRDRSGPAASATAGSGQNNTSAVGGYDAYFGTYRVGKDRLVLHRLEAALSPGNVRFDGAPAFAGASEPAIHLPSNPTPEREDLYPDVSLETIH